MAGGQRPLLMMGKLLFPLHPDLLGNNSCSQLYNFISQRSGLETRESLSPDQLFKASESALFKGGPPLPFLCLEEKCLISHRLPGQAARIIQALPPPQHAAGLDLRSWMDWHGVVFCSRSQLKREPGQNQ